MWIFKSWFGFDQTDITEASAYKPLEVADHYKYAKTLSSHEDMKGQVFYTSESDSRQYVTIYPHQNTAVSYVSGGKLRPNA